VLSCGDSTGNKIVVPLLNFVKNLGIELKENTGVLAVSKQEDLFKLQIKAEGEPSDIYSKSVILATGGLLPKEKKAGIALGDMADFPDGIGLAEQLNAEVVNADLTQYHPTGVVLPKALRRDRFPETMRASGARLLNKHGEEFIDPLLTRKIVQTAIVEECQKGNGIETEDGYVGVWFTCQEIDEKMGDGYTQKHYPKFYNLFMKHGHDITKEPVLVYPIVHYSLGGVRINEKTETTVEGFFAAGETTWGVHGEERLMGNSLLDIFVFGRIAGKQAIQYALKK
jgi:aspartate oxidase